MYNSYRTFFCFNTEWKFTQKNTLLVTKVFFFFNCGFESLAIFSKILAIFFQFTLQKKKIQKFPKTFATIMCEFTQKNQMPANKFKNQNPDCLMKTCSMHPRGLGFFSFGRGWGMWVFSSLFWVGGLWVFLFYFGSWVAFCVITHFCFALVCKLIVKIQSSFILFT